MVLSLVAAGKQPEAFDFSVLHLWLATNWNYRTVKTLTNFASTAFDELKCDCLSAHKSELQHIEFDCIVLFARLLTESVNTNGTTDQGLNCRIFS